MFLIGLETFILRREDQLQLSAPNIVRNHVIWKLGDIVFVDLPEVGTDLNRGGSFGTVESVKAVEEMYAPLSGEVLQRNEALLANPEELQKDPHGEGWLLVIRPSDVTQLEQLMDAATYSAKVAAS